jgi:hypothetical protein
VSESTLSEIIEPTRDCVAVATDAIAAIGNALGILNEPSPWIENMRVAILSRIGEMRKSVSRIEEIRKAELVAEGDLAPVPPEDIRQMVRNCIIEVAASGPPLHATTFGALAGAVADRVAKEYSGRIWRASPTAAQAAGAGPSVPTSGFAMVSLFAFGDSRGAQVIHAISRNQDLREIEVTRMRCGRQHATSLVVPHDGPATCANCANPDLPDVYVVQKPPKASPLEAENAKLWQEINRLNLLINSPQTESFVEAVRVEAAHQVRYWGTARDANKRTEDWVTMIVCLLGKAFNFNGDRDKLLQHVITLAAICLNWHSRIIAPRSGDGPVNDKEGAQKRSADNLRSVDALIAREGLDR